MEMILKNEGVVYRTKCMTLERAAGFARCLEGNARFEGIEIAESRRAKGEARWFVLYAPTNSDRRWDMVTRQQEGRLARAFEQSFTFCADKDAGRLFFWCHSHQSGEVYEVTPQTCNCPDTLHRLQGTPIRCKHRIALDLALHRGEVVEFETIPARPAFDKAEFERIFG